MSNKLDLTLKQGEDFYRVLTIKDSNNVVVDITGYTFTAQIRETATSNLYLSFSFNISDALNGVVEMTMAKELSSAKKIRSKEKFLYDVEMNDTTRVSRIMEGVVTITPEITK